MRAQLEPIFPPTQYSFVARRFREPSFDHPFHYHPEIEITYIVRSSGTRIIGDHMGAFEPGDLCLIGENLPHIYRNSLNPSGGAESEVLHFHRDLAHGFLDSVPELADFSALLDRAQLGLRFDSATAASVGRMLVQLRDATGPDRWTLFMELVSCLLGAESPEVLSSAGFAGRLGPHLPDRIQGACQYILENFDKELSHQSVAERVHLSPAHFSRLFKRTTHKTYTEFLTEVRLGHACRLLIETEQPIIDIAYNSGFRNLSSFNRRFLKTYHCSPRTYRKRHPR